MPVDEHAGSVGTPIRVPGNANTTRPRANVVAALLSCEPESIFPSEEQGWHPRGHGGEALRPGDANTVKDARMTEVAAYLKYLEMRVAEINAEQRWRADLEALLARNWNQAMSGQRIPMAVAGLPGSDRGELNRLQRSRPPQVASVSAAIAEAMGE